MNLSAFARTLLFAFEILTTLRNIRVEQTQAASIIAG